MATSYQDSVTQVTVCSERNKHEPDERILVILSFFVGMCTNRFKLVETIEETADSRRDRKSVRRRDKGRDTIKTKFSLLQRYLLISLMALFLTSVWSYSAFQDIEQENRRIVEEAIPISNAVSELFRLLLDQELSVRGYTYNQDAQSLEQYEATKQSFIGQCGLE